MKHDDGLMRFRFWRTTRGDSAATRPATAATAAATIATTATTSSGHPEPERPDGTCGRGEHGHDQWNGPFGGPGLLTRSWTVVGPIQRAWLCHGVIGDDEELALEPGTRLRFDGSFDQGTGAIATGVHAFYILDGRHAGCCILFAIDDTNSVGPFMEMHPEVAPVGV